MTITTSDITIAKAAKAAAAAGKTVEELVLEHITTTIEA